MSKRAFFQRNAKMFVLGIFVLCMVLVLTLFISRLAYKQNTIVVKPEIQQKEVAQKKEEALVQPAAAMPVDEKNLIKIGTILGLTGSTRETHLKILEGLTLRIDKANKSGELGNKKIILTALDHEYVPAVAVKRMEELVQDYKIDIIISPSGTDVINACIPVIRKNKILVFGSISRPTLPCDDLDISFLTVSFPDEAAKLVEYSLTMPLIKKVAIFYQDDNFGKSMLNRAMGILKTANFVDQNILVTGYEPNTTRVSKSVTAIRNFTPNGLFVFALVPPTVALLSNFTDAAVLKYLFGLSSINNGAVAKLFSDKGFKFIRTHLIPNYKEQSADMLDITKNYLDALKEKNLEPDDLSFECFVTADLFIELLQKIVGTITKEKIVQKMEILKNYDLKGLKINYDNQNRQFLHDIWIETETGDWIYSPLNTKISEQK